MADLKLKAGVTATDALTTGLDSLANGARAISAAIDNSTNLDMFMDLQLKVKYTTTAPAAGVITAEVYLIPSVDGTNYGEGGTGLTPQASRLVATFESRNGSTSTFEYLNSLGIPIPIGSFKLLLVNKSGYAYASADNLLTYRTYKLQSV